MGDKTGLAAYDLDPIQGHDVKITTASYGGVGTEGEDKADTSPQGAFTDILVKLVVQTETFLPMHMKVPRFLDGEVIIVWSASGGVLDFGFVQETFGYQFANSIASGRGTRVRRSNRFSITAELDVDEDANNLGVEGFNNEFATKKQDGANQQLKLLLCRCDTLTFGVQAGKGYAVNSWQGTAEGLETPGFKITASTKKK